MARQWRQGEYSGLALLAGGFLLVTMSIAGYFIGSLIDRALHSSPTGAIIGLLIGTVIGFWDLYRIAARIMNRQPAPTVQEQQQAQENWEKFEKAEENEGLRDENHE